MGLRHPDVLTRAPRVLATGRRGAHASLAIALLLASKGALADAAPAPSPAEAPPSPTTIGAPAPDDEPSERAVLGPVLTDDETAKEPTLRRVVPTDAVALRAREVEAALRDAAQDLGLELEVGAQIPGDGASELDLLKAAASGHWAISPRLRPVGHDTYLLRMVAVPPNGQTLLVRVEKVQGAQLAARAVVMLRDFVQAKLAAPPAPPRETATAPADDDEGRSRGRPVLAASSTLFGLYTAFAIHRAGGKDDPRLLYPLLALGSGIGLGASLLAADEWNVTNGAAWTIAAGSWWGVLAGFNYATGRDVRPVDDRPMWGLAGGLIGTTAAVAWVGLGHFDEGDAALVHSGAAIGTFTGGAIDFMVRGTLNESPATGLGLGAGAGFLAGGALAAVVQTRVQRVMLVDLGAGLGALGGAALASPLLFKNESETKTRLFLGAVLGGTAIGGALAWIATRGHPEAQPSKKPAGSLPTRFVPTIGLGPDGSYTAGVAGLF